MNAIKRFGSAMIVPVLMFAFFGIVLGFATLFKNPTIMGSLADQHTFWFKFWSVIESGGWVIFTHMEVVFVVGLPLSLAKKAPGHAALAALMGYLMFNTFINAILTQWPHTFGANLEKGVENVPGLKSIAGIATLDTNILGGIIISAIITWIHNRYYSKRLPEMVGVFQGLTFVVTISFFVDVTISSNYLCYLANCSARYWLNATLYHCFRLYRCMVVSLLRTCINTNRITSLYLCAN